MSWCFAAATNELNLIIENFYIHKNFTFIEEFNFGKTRKKIYVLNSELVAAAVGGVRNWKLLVLFGIVAIEVEGYQTMCIHPHVRWRIFKWNGWNGVCMLLTLQFNKSNNAV